jgi:chromosome segregation ATPase
MESDTPRTDALMVNGCIAITILEFSRTLERELNNATPAPVWPEILRLQGKIADLEGQLQESHAQSHGIARRVVEAETVLEVAQGDLATSNAALDQMTEDAVNLKAEVERLRELVKYAVWVLKSYNPKYAEEIEGSLNPPIEPPNERAEKAEAEVERLQRQLKNYHNAIESL